MAATWITAERVEALEAGARLELAPDEQLTPPAAELAARRGIQVVQAGASQTGGPHAVHAHDASEQHGGKSPRRLIVTAVGVNRPGVMAELSSSIGELGGDILDLSQRITGGYFNAILLVDIARSGKNFSAYREALAALSKPSDYVVTVIDERVFKAMHRL